MVRKYRFFGAIALFSVVLTGWMAVAPSSGGSIGWQRRSAEKIQAPIFAIQPAQAQWRGTDEAASRVYAQMPDLPLANDYISNISGNANPENTFVNRLIRYHLYTRRRSPTYRLDWKITLADYLGLNEWMRDNEYPGSDILRTNPLEGDRALVDSLTRSQRNQLVNTLASIFNSGATAADDPDSNSTIRSGGTRSEPSASDLVPAADAADLLIP